MNGSRPAGDGPDSELLAFLDVCRDVVLFCRDRAGNPIGYPMRTVACGSSGLTFTTYRKTAKVRNIEQDPRVCVFAAERERKAVRWVSVTGTARVVAPSEPEIQRAFGAGEGDGSGRVPEGMGELVKQRLRDGKRILLQVEHLRAPGIRSGLLP